MCIRDRSLAAPYIQQVSGLLCTIGLPTAIQNLLLLLLVPLAVIVALLYSCLLYTSANPTPMTFSEVYIGLQQGTIDAQENPYEVVVSGKIYEQQDYIVQTNHLPHLLSLIVNDEFYQSLSSEDQKIVDKAAENARNYARQQADERVNDRLNIICLLYTSRCV